jgi:hypothetical protein
MCRRKFFGQDTALVETDVDGKGRVCAFQGLRTSVHARACRVVLYK